ncbi:N/N'-diacetyllegionaminate synthase [Synechococcus sp. BIOS-U3-1]|uniref:pseudaminic acid synthase n=1 Tax=Synechococcus sp. BIOS-U3-1 TaxID=1400865 RepID=UPI0016450314|nr:pseudaminic acid synthase [Synechococcus sp. BIOS-U3-1]QNI57173.1 N/N'-diacetyllegionaminate synthase [Synechococcus sp. BIOS-U3-1]
MAKSYSSLKHIKTDKVMKTMETCYVIAEISGNHGNSWERCLRLLDSCKWANVNAIKTQHYRPESITIESNRSEFLLRDTLWQGRTLFDIYTEGAMHFEWQGRIKKYCQENKIDFICTPFDSRTTDEIVSIGCKNLKVASSEANDIEFVRYVLKNAKKCLVSLGMASIEEIERIYTSYLASNCKDLTLLQCTAAYPAPLTDANIARIPELIKRYECNVGLSDHSLGIHLPLIAMGAGARVFEKHITLERSDGALDSAFSLTPAEFKELVYMIKEYSKTIGRKEFGPTESEKTAYKYRRSLYVVNDIMKGDIIQREDLRSIRPANGLHPCMLEKVIGLRAKKDIKTGTPLTKEDVESLS